jgi:hypothetical protein
VVVCIGPGTTAEFDGGEYAGGAGSLSFFGRRVGVVVANGLVDILLWETETVGVTLDEGDLAARDVVVVDLDPFLEPNFFKLNGMLSLEDVLICEQKVGVGEMAILCGK